jgi:hypothetical protein
MDRPYGGVMLVGYAIQKARHDTLLNPGDGRALGNQYSAFSKRHHKGLADG